MRPAQATRFNAQLWVGSTAGGKNSFYWYGKVLAGRKQLADASPSRVAYFEWSLPDEIDIEDEDSWWEYMPALGHTITPEFVRSELERARRNPDEGGESLWRRAYGNQWVDPPMMGENAGVIDGALWASLVEAGSRIVSHRSWALAVSPDRKWATFGVAGRREDGCLHVEWKDRRGGTDWVVESAVRSWDETRLPLRIHKQGPEGSFIAPLRERGVEVVEVSSAEVAAATGQLIDAANAGQLRHLGQASLDIALKGAVLRTSSDGAALWSQRNSSVEITALMACTVAAGGVPVTAAVDLLTQAF